MAASLSPVMTLVRRHDPDRFLTALFAPAEKRHALMTLYAFNHELARAREVTREPTIALMRLQWWREVVEGARRSHEVAEPLGDLLQSGELARDDLLAVIDAREKEAEPAIGTLAEWRQYVLGTAGGLAVAAGRLLGAPEPEALRPSGAAYGAAGVVRNMPLAARQGRCLLPLEVLEQHGLAPETMAVAPGSDAARAAVSEVAAEGLRFLESARQMRLPRRARAAALPAVLARRDLRRDPFPIAERGLGDRLAVIWGAMTGRL